MAIAERLASWGSWGPRVADVRPRVQGAVIEPHDRTYEQARTVWNRAIDRRPALVVRCADAADVACAVIVARAQGLPVAIRSGGHSLAGHSTCDGGLVIDLSAMKAIGIDPVRQIARIEPGLTWGEVAGEAQQYGLALTSGDTATVGVGGLTLGGGIGWMVRKHGLTIDNLRSVDLVTADGQVVTASAEVNADLFWGLRGGGGNFGVATAFEFQLHPAGLILGGAVFYEAGEASEILRSYARHAAAAPDELTTMALLMPAPPAPFIPPERQGEPILAIAVCYAGDLAEGERVVAPLRRLGTPIADVVGPMPYSAMFALTTDGEVRGNQHHVRSLFLETLDEGVLETIVAQAHAIMSPGTIVQLRILGGAMGRMPADATAFAHRDKPAMLTVIHYGPAGADEAACLRSRTERVWQALRPYAAGVYVNFLGDEGEERIRAAYPPATYARLVALKDRYDPENLFRLNQNVMPSGRLQADSLPTARTV